MPESKKYYIKTFGCQANKNDSERIKGKYQNLGFEQILNWKQADLIIINTCAVRERVEHRVRALVNKIKNYYQQQQKAKPKIILGGCMLHHGEKKIKQMMPSIDEILSIDSINFDYPAIRNDKNHAFVQISTGCNAFCSYCIVPYARGREQSRPMGEILTEIKHLTDRNYTEITLLGQNVNSYGLENTPIPKRKQLIKKKKPPFVQLLEKICKNKKIQLIRFMSANPWDFSDYLIEVIAQNDVIDRYIHLPIQSGSNSVLKRMNRHYTKEEYLELVQKIRKKIPKATIGTDIIVGFPNETDQEFQETLKLAKQINWKIAFIALYSPRPHTIASKLYKDNVNHKTKKKRWLTLEKLINRKNLNTRPKVV